MTLAADQAQSLVEFRMVVFRPFKGEVMMARISTSTPEGIHLQTDFFADIFVSYEYLPPGAELCVFPLLNGPLTDRH